MEEELLTLVLNNSYAVAISAILLYYLLNDQRRFNAKIVKCLEKVGTSLDRSASFMERLEKILNDRR